MPVNGKTSNGRFQLPQLTPVNYSLTDGTDIPPPPISPIEEKAPPPATKAALENVAPISTSTNVASQKRHSVYDGRGRASVNDKPPMSPVSTTRPSSIRRFLSRKSLNTNYTSEMNNNNSSEDVRMIDRPESAMSFNTNGRPGLKNKKSGGWFRSFGSRSEAGNRTSVVYEDEKPKRHMGPPPPKLPELNQLKAKVTPNDEGSLGGEDMFKNIK